MDHDLQSDWIDRFVMRLSRLQLDTSPDMLVDMALSRWWQLRELRPEAAAEIEYDELSRNAPWLAHRGAAELRAR